MKSKVNILGTKYTIETHKVSEDSYLEKTGLPDTAERKIN